MKKQDVVKPEIEAIGWEKTSKGYRVVVISASGTEYLTDPEPRAMASERIKLEVIRRLLMPKDHVIF